jgi:hypothetical protein
LKTKRLHLYGELMGRTRVPQALGAGSGPAPDQARPDQAGRKRRTEAMIAMTKSTSTTPWVTANGGSLGGTLGAS